MLGDDGNRKAAAASVEQRSSCAPSMQNRLVSAWSARVGKVCDAVSPPRYGTSSVARFFGACAAAPWRAVYVLYVHVDGTGRSRRSQPARCNRVEGCPAAQNTREPLPSGECRRSRYFGLGAVPGLEELLAKWERLFELRDAFAVRADKPSYFNLPHERKAFRDAQIDGWLGLILGHLNIQAPAGEAWSGHSLRKGAASGAGALDVALFRICFMGGWSIRSAAVHDYIDASCPASPAAWRFFGWLVRR